MFSFSGRVCAKPFQLFRGVSGCFVYLRQGAKIHLYDNGVCVSSTTPDRRSTSRLPKIRQLLASRAAQLLTLSFLSDGGTLPVTDHIDNGRGFARLLDRQKSLAALGDAVKKMVDP